MRHSPSLLVLVFAQCFDSNSNVFRPLQTPNAPTRILYIHRTKDQDSARTLVIILCVSDALAEREAERTDEVVREQLGEVVKELSADVSGWK